MKRHETEPVTPWTIPYRSQEFIEGPRLKHVRDVVELCLDHERPSGGYEWSTIRFEGVVEFSFYDHELCTAEQIAAYDTIVELPGAKPSVRFLGEMAPTRRFRIYFDEIGCYELVARKFSLTE